MIGEKEKIIKEILSEMALDSESSFQLECVLSRVLYDYSLQKIESTQITTRDENLNDEAYRMFFISKGIKGLSKRTLQYYKYTIDKFRTIVDKPFQEVEPNDIRYFLAVIKMQGHYNEVSLNNERRNISAFFGWMADNEYITRNPVRRVEKVKEKKNVKKPLKDTEIEILKRHARNDIRTIALIEVLLSTACRVSEVVGMNREDIDGDEIVVKGKGNKERVVFLNAKALVTLNEYLQTRDDDNPALFVSMDEPHERLKVSGIENILRRLGRECGIEKVHPHRFRRTSATQALNKGMDIEQIAQMMGHDSIETTKIYAKSSKENVKASHARYLG